MTSRALRVLAAFGPDRPTLTLTELARRADVPLSTAHRLAGELVAWGALERDADGCFCIGLRLGELASLAPRGQALRHAARPFLEDLFEVTRENVQLAVLEESEVLVLERVSGPSAIRILGRVGGRLPAHPTAVGRALLAHAPAAVRDRVLARPLAALTPYTLTDPLLLGEELRAVAEAGVAVTWRQVTADACSVAAPVAGPDGAVVAALAIVVPVTGAEPAVLVPAVQAAARGVSRALRTAAQAPAPT